jgi:endogenous inhibitor of DNA gyrase (YacG/DUF329 family)
MAYILGFTFADGNVYQNTVSWALAKNRENKKLLKKINKSMKSSYLIKEQKDRFQLRINHSLLVKDLISLGVIPNKTKKCIFPEIPNPFLRDFIRGFLDGDGWITAKKKKMEISVGFSKGSYKFIKGLAHKLNKNLSLPSYNLKKKNKLIKNKKISTTYEIEYYSNNAYKIIRYLYDGLKRRDLFLMRKYQKQLKARKIYEDLMRGTKLWRKIEDKHNRPMKEILFHLYKEKGLDGLQMAKKLGVHSSSIYRWLEKTKIKIPNKKIRHIIVAKCPICAKEIKYYQGQFKKYCSSQCRFKARQTGKTMRCVVCGEKLYRPKWWFKVNTIPLCSRVCFGKWQILRLKKNLVRRNQRTGRFLSSVPFKFKNA